MDNKLEKYRLTPAEILEPAKRTAMEIKEPELSTVTKHQLEQLVRLNAQLSKLLPLLEEAKKEERERILDVHFDEVMDLVIAYIKWTRTFYNAPLLYDI